MRIRESTENDTAAIVGVHQDAFGDEEGEVVSKLTAELLDDPTALPLLSLVAEEDNRIVGHILFSSVTVRGTTVSNAYILAPLGVLEDQQGRGIGQALMSQGLRILKDRKAEFVLVLGHPKYYSRAGFEAGHGISPPYDLAYPDAWMALELAEGALKNVRGTVQCAASLSAPEYW